MLIELVKLRRCCFFLLSLFVACSIPVSAGLDDGLVAWWKLDEGTSTTSFDSSDYNRSLSLQNGTSWTAGQINQGVQLDGVDDELSPPSILVESDFSVSLWVNPQSSTFLGTESNSENNAIDPLNRTIIKPMHGGGSSFGLGLTVGTNGVSTLLHAGSIYCQPLVHELAISSWVHLALIFDNRQPKLFVNGALVKTGLVLGRPTKLSVSASSPIGKGYEVEDHYQGGVDEVRIYDRALSSAEVFHLYAFPFDLNSNSPLTLTENSQEGIIIGEFNATDPNGDTLTYLMTPSLPIEFSPVLWLDANDSSTVIDSGGAVSEWQDKSGNDYHFTQNDITKCPLYAATSLNGMPTITFDGSNDYLSISSRLGFSANPDISVFTVTSFTALLSNDERIFQLGTNYHGLAVTGGTGSWCWRFNGGHERYNDVSINTAALQAWVRQAGTNYAASRFFYNGLEQARVAGSSDTSSPTNVGEIASIGKSTTGSNFASVKISELIVLNDSSEASRRAIETYLAHKWGLSYGQPTSDGTFMLESNGTLKSLVSLDRESMSLVPITVRATDPSGNYIDQNFSLSVLDDGLEDTDGDGFLDSLEISSGSGETNASSLPSNLPSFLGGAKLWIDSTNVDLKQNTTLSNGSQITQWFDQSGNAKNLSVINSNNAPLLSTGLFNSKDSVSFTNDSLKTSQALSVRSILAVHKTSASGYLWDLRDSIANSWIYGSSAGGYWGTHISNGVTKDSVSSSSIMNNQLQVGYFAGSANGSSNFYLHSRFNGVEYGTGEICELLIFDRLLSQQEIDSGEAYLAHKWGLSNIVDSDGDGLMDIQETNGYSKYEQIDGAFSWTSAKTEAENRGGHLATIANQSEQTIVSSLINGNIWLGGTDLVDEGNWTWVDGSSWVFSNWSVEQEFNATGGDQTFVVPAGVTNLSVKIWGAGGGGGRASYRGGAGGYTEGNLTVTPGETLTLVVGEGGILHSGFPLNRDYRYGGGASGGGSGSYNLTFGSGGGRSAVRRGNVELATAGGGGGGGYSDNGRNGGGANGLPVLGSLSGAYPQGGLTNNNGAGPGGTGGTHGQSGSESGVSGVQFKGGYSQGINGGASESGGGGGGYFGGGGGGDNRGGGGGSGYFGALSNGSTSGSSHGTLYPPNTADLVYPGTSNPVAGSGSVGTAGDGASSGNSTGGDGFIVMQWSTTQVINNADSDYLAIDSENSGKWAAYPSSQNLGFLLEKTFYSDPKLSDSDGDGFADNVEYDAGTDPDSNTSIPTLAYGLIAWYPFDGNASDMSGNGRNATAVNTHSYVSAKVGNGVRIVGSDSAVDGHVMLPYISSLENADTTFAFWVLEEAMLQSHGEAYLAYGQIESVLNYSGGQPFSFSSSTSYIAGITRSAWNHYTVTKIGSVKKGYLNGTMVAQGSWTAPSSYSPTFSALGRHWWANGAGTSSRLVATFDDLRIYDRALMASEITALQTWNPGNNSPSNNAPMIPVLSQSQVSENRSVGTSIGQFSSSDPDGDTISFHLVQGVGDTGNAYFILETNGSLNTAVIFDFENNASTYSIRVEARDEHNLSTEGNFTVSLLDLDDTAPVISLNGDANITHEGGTAYIDANASWTDAVDGSGSILASGQVNTGTPGSYVLSFNYTDGAGNAAQTVTRTVQVVDTSLPVISLNGDANITHEGGTSYIDANASWTDAVDGSGTILASGQVNTGTPGSYVLSFNYTDGAGNAAQTVTRTVQVVDTSLPVISLNGDANITHEGGTAYIDANASWTDAVDGSGTILASGQVNTGTPGSYVLSFNYTDGAGNAAQTVTRTVQVVDTSLPVISLNGDANITHEGGTAYIDANASWTDTVDGSGTILASGQVNTGTPGSYVLSFNYTDGAGNAAQTVTRTVQVVDTSLPVISLNGDANITHEGGTSYIDANASWTDAVDGSGTILASGQVNTGTPGSYVLSFNYTDGAGNAAQTVTRTVQVVDTSLPVISLNGDANITHEGGTAYIDANASWTDAVDGSGTILASGQVNTGTPGSYVLSFNYTDGAGNAAQTVTRTVQVVDTSLPVISLNGDANITHEGGTTYIDANASWTDTVDGSGIILASGQVNTGTPGSYVLSFNYTDGAGNAAQTVTRTVQVVDTSLPLISLNGDANITHEGGTAYIDANASWTDTVDGSGIILASGQVNTGTPGSYVLSFNYTDGAGNAAQTVTRTVQVVDTSLPVISLNGDANITHEGGTAYIDANASWTDTVDGSGTILASGQVNTGTPGSYVLSFNYTDGAGNAAQTVTRTVQVVDTSLPVISLNGDANITHEGGTSYIDANASWTDTVDGSGTILASGQVNTGTPGSYVLSFNYTDGAGNAAQTVTRTVQVVDTSLPVISLNGDANITHEGGTAYIDANASWTDAVDGSGTILASGQVNTGTPGSYILSFNYTDGAGNAAQAVTRTVEVTNLSPHYLYALSDLNLSVYENEPNGTWVANFEGLDGNPDHVLFYELVRVSDGNQSAEQNASYGNLSEIEHLNVFHLDSNGSLTTLRPIDYEIDPLKFEIVVRVTDQHGAYFEAPFLVNVLNVVEDFDEDGIEDHFDLDDDGDGYPDEVEKTYGFNPHERWEYPDVPIVRTLELIEESNDILRFGMEIRAEGGFEKLQVGIEVLDLSGNLLLEKVFEWNATSVAKVTFLEDGFIRGQVIRYQAYAENLAGRTLGQLMEYQVGGDVALDTWWASDLELTGGWRESIWMGTYQPNLKNNWIYHLELGWLFIEVDNQGGCWMWMSSNGWLWTSQETWPFLWANETADWLYPFYSGNKLYFYDYQTESFR